MHKLFPVPRTTLAIILAVSLLTTGCADTLDLLPASGPLVTEAGKSPGTPAAEDYYTVLGTAQRSYTPTVPGEVAYCPLDELGRSVCAYAELTSFQRNKAQTEGREDITVDPAGWTRNSQVFISALVTVPGSDGYKGWFWNRSHLIADSLGGDAVGENLITGTRTQNVGSTQVEGQYAGGMAYTELLARDYLNNSDADSCPLYYAATPQYTGGELIPRTVVVDVQSCDASIDLSVAVSNTANGFVIDYSSGNFTPAK